MGLGLRGRDGGWLFVIKEWTIDRRAGWVEWWVVRSGFCLSVKRTLR